MSRSFILNKLVRDSVPTAMAIEGQTVELQTLTGNELLQALKAKLAEEAAELLAASDNTNATNELADIQEVIDALLAAQGSDRAALSRVQEQRRLERGSFANGQFVGTITMADDDPWAAYYAAEPTKYKEI